MLIVTSPSTGALVREYPETTPSEVKTKLSAARRAFHSWRTVSLEERARPMRALGERLFARRDELARLMATEMGKPVAQGRSEVEKSARACGFYADHAAGLLADVPAETDAATSYVTFEPLGVILAVMPWNFPLWQVVRFAAPALMAGNAAVLKHASNVSGMALTIESMIREASFPEGLFATLLLPAARVSGLIAAPEIAAVTLTGSTDAGRAVATEAGARLKKTVLELGGSDPYVILEDADLERAAEACAEARLMNGGQSCIAAKRFVVVEPVRARFQALLVERMAAYAPGDPFNEATLLGPMARADLRDDLHRQVERSIGAGARLLLGGRIPEGPGAYYPPTVLTDVRPGMPAYDEETFGPVAAVIAARDEADAIRIANDTCFGLGAAVFTRNVERGERIAARSLEAGSCFVNTFVRSDPRLPFGGVKDSGFGRELSVFGIREFVNIKTVYVAAPA